MYQVKWQGYDELTWEPEENEKDCAVLETYLAEEEKEAIAAPGTVGRRIRPYCACRCARDWIAIPAYSSLFFYFQV